VKSIKRAIMERLSGGRPSSLRALLAAVIAGAVVAVLVYRLLRS
jgi:hypothetical protein